MHSLINNYHLYPVLEKSLLGKDWHWCEWSKQYFPGLYSKSYCTLKGRTSDTPSLPWQSNNTLASPTAFNTPLRTACILRIWSSDPNKSAPANWPQCYKHMAEWGVAPTSYIMDNLPSVQQNNAILFMFTT